MRISFEIDKRDLEQLLRVVEYMGDDLSDSRRLESVAYAMFCRGLASKIDRINEVAERAVEVRR